MLQTTIHNKTKEEVLTNRKAIQLRNSNISNQTFRITYAVVKEQNI